MRRGGNWRSIMKREQVEQWVSLAVDGELPEDRRADLEHGLEAFPDLRTKLTAWDAIGKELTAMSFSKEHDRELDRFEGHVFARIERGIAWIFLSIGSVLALATGLFYFGRDFLFDAGVVWTLRLGVAVGLTGLAILAVSVVRHRVATYRSDKYKGVER
jgi:hypothetical protein